MSAELATIEPPVEVRRLPLWKNLLEEMCRAGLKENAVYSLDHFTKGLEAAENSVQFAFGVHEIRRALRRLGWVLTSRGQNGAQFLLLPRGRNVEEMLRLQNAAVNALREGVILGTNTPIDTLTDEERRRHESVLEKMAKRAALLGRDNRMLK